MFRVGVGGLELTSADKAAVNRVLDSNRLSYGPYSKRFEWRFAALHGSRYAVFTNSGTSALQLALQALKERYRWRGGGEVIVPAVTFVATANIVLQNGMMPKFVDVNPATFNIDEHKIKDAITEATRAIIPVHLLGLPASMGPILDMARKHRLRVIEDSAETMFARYMGRPVGSFGDIGCFSTYIAHYIVTGVGGLNTTSDPRLAVRLRSLANHGRDSIYLSIDDSDKGREVIGRRFRFTSVGHSYRATEMEAALGLSQLRRYRSIMARRQEIAARYLGGLLDLDDHLAFQYTPSDRENAYMLFGVVVRNKKKGELVRFLEEAGIETRDMLPLTNQPIYRKLYGNMDKRYPVAAFLNKAAFYIGCHQYLTNGDVDYVIRKFHEFYKR